MEINSSSGDDRSSLEAEATDTPPRRTTRSARSDTRSHLLMLAGEFNTPLAQHHKQRNRRDCHAERNPLAVRQAVIQATLRIAAKRFDERTNDRVAGEPG